MGDTKDDHRLLTQLTTLVRHGRTFGHRDTPLAWTDVRRVGTLGRMRLVELHGETAWEVAEFTRHWEQAFIPPMSVRQPGRVDKPDSDVLNIAPADLLGLPVDLTNLRLETFPDNYVCHLNKIDLRHALQYLVEAAYSVRKRLRQQCESTSQTLSKEAPSRGSGGDPTCTVAGSPTQAGEKGRSQGRPRGPKRNYETAARVVVIVQRVAPEGDWKDKLDKTCDALDKAVLPYPKTWPTREVPLKSWEDGANLEPGLAKKAIEYWLKVAKQRKKTTPETLS